MWPRMDFTVVTIFPGMFDGFAGHGIMRRAAESGRITIRAVDIRDFAEGRHRVTDDRPYGGGSGMVMKPDPLAKAIRFARKDRPQARAILLSPQGRRFDQREAEALSAAEGIVFVCGRYEGVDERVYESDIDDELSIGDYVLTGGELAAMVVMDAVIRLIPGTLGNESSSASDSFSDGLLEHAHYTRPSVFEEKAVPEVLLSGHHGEVARWRLESSLIRTFLKRPDLLEQRRRFSRDEKRILRKWHDRLALILQEDRPGGRGENPG